MNCTATDNQFQNTEVRHVLLIYKSVFSTLNCCFVLAPLIPVYSFSAVYTFGPVQLSD
jgi:hypothetical protein